MKQHRIWIELPTAADNETALENVAEANNMMRKLGAVEDVFGWDQDNRHYVRYLPYNAGFVVLNDNGDWFNLKNLAA
jgi:hypothetical protein